MKLNTLRIEPHIVKFERQPKAKPILWRIWIDDKKITQTCYPFSVFSKSIELVTDADEFLWGLGDGHVVVRNISRFVAWVGIIDFMYSDILDGTYPESPLYFFERELYETEIDLAIQKSITIKPQFKVFDVGNMDFQPASLSEILLLIQKDFPKNFYETVIYREPKSSTDTTGTIILRRMEIAINNSSEFTIVDPPEKSVELRIGLDEAEFTEAIWHIGKVNGQFAIYFEQKPSFPVWLQSPEFDKVLSQESFVKDL
ncbi:MAG: hypothetical protein AAFV93_09510 [Chloroflexota bacterium]